MKLSIFSSILFAALLLGCNKDANQNNAILIMDETSTLHAAGVKMHDAMLQASQKKFRPILMTSIASVIGMLPMAFGRGIGYEIRSSCGIGVVGGLLFAMFLTLYFIPALFYVSHRRQRT